MSRITSGLCAALALGLGGLLAAVLLALPDKAGLRVPVAAHLDASGLDHAVSAVLLNFRAHDTFLELGVLLLAVLGAWSLGRYRPLPAHPVPGPVMPATVRLLLPVAVVIGVYLLWVGSQAPGGAFQAGSVLGAAAVLWALSRPRKLPRPSPLLLRLGLVAGVALFLSVGVTGGLLGFGFMGYPPAGAKALILLIETGATISIALTLAALFLGGDPHR